MKRLKNALTILFVVFFLVSNVYAADYAKHITVIGTSDMHGNIWGFSYEDNSETANNGMARLYTYIEGVRA